MIEINITRNLTGDWEIGCNGNNLACTLSTSGRAYSSRSSALDQAFPHVRYQHSGDTVVFTIEGD